MKIPVLNLFLFLFFFPNINSISAQERNTDKPQNTLTCGAKALRKQAMIDNPTFRKTFLQLEKKAYFATSNPSKKAQANYTLPVVIHIIHDNGAENISDAEVLQGMVDLNDAFANANYYDQGTGLNTNIEFCLARRAPDGTGTSGINRVQSTLTEMTPSDDLDLKNLSRWDPLSYINIWLVREMCTGANCGLAGYANFPALHGLPADGIVMEARWFGSSKGNSGVQIHEMGHYLGLYHTFQGGCTNNDCALDGDRVCDTPPDQSTAVVPCGGTANSCSTDTNSGFATDQNDMYWNYMDYGDWNCYSAFTQGQTNRMTFFLDNKRNSLTQSLGCTDPCPVSTAISIASTPTQVDVGTTLTFTVSSPQLTQFEWFINNVSAGTGASLTYTFSNKGNYIISVEGTNGNPLCLGIDFVNLEVVCPVEASFTASSFQVFLNESVLFTSTSVNATSLEWYIDGILESTANSFSHTFTEEGNREVILIAKSNICSDTTDLQYVYVSHPCGTGGTKQLYTDNHRPAELRKLADGGLVAIYYPNGVNPVANITRLDADQNLVWVKTVNSLQGVEIRDVVEDPSDNGLIFCGEILDQSTNRGSVFKLDANGNYLWGQKTNIPDARLNHIDLAPDGNFLICGSDKRDTSQVVKMQSDGTMLWSKRYYKFWETDFKVMSDGSMYLSGDTGFVPGGFSSAALTRLDANGNVLWSTRYIDPFLGSAFHAVNCTIEANEADNVVLAYSVQDDTFKKYDVLVSLDNTGDIIWKNKYYLFYQPPNYETEGPVHAITKTPDGGYVFYSVLTNDQPYTALTKVNAQGDPIWCRNLTPAFNLHRHYPRIEILDNNNMAIGHYENLFITDANGMLGPCPVTDLPIEIYPHTLDVHPHTVQDIGSFTFISTSGNTSDGSFNPVSSCETQNASQPDAELIAQDAALCNGDYTINWQVCNVGTGILPIGTPYSLYDGNPTTSTALLISTQILSMDLAPNQCRSLQTTVASLPINKVHIVFNDDGTLAPPFSLEVDLATSASLIECNFFNNLDSLSLANIPTSIPMPFLGNDTTICSGQNLPLGPGIFSAYLWQDASIEDSLTAVAPGIYRVTVTDACGETQTDEINIQWHNAPTLDLGPDIMICDNGVIPLDAGADFEEYLWSDGSKEQTTTAWLSGEYFVKATDACGGVQRDTIVITFDPGTVLDLQTEYISCIGEDLSISVPGYLDYQWSPAGILDCDNCADVVFNVDMDRTFYLLVQTSNGCYSSDSVNIIVQDTVKTFEDRFICEGETTDVFGKQESTTGVFDSTFTSINGCDSTHAINLTVLDTIASADETFFCEGDSVLVFGNWIKTAGTYFKVFSAANTCDSTHRIEVKEVSIINSNEDRSICLGDSSFIFGNWEKTADTYSATFLSSLGCDSIHHIELKVQNMLLSSDQVNLCQGDSTFIFGNWEKMAGTYSQTFITTFGCDSTHSVEVILADTFLIQDEISICDGDSSFIFGNWEKNSGTYIQNYATAFGCDSIHSIDLQVQNIFATNDEIVLCEGDSSFIFGNWEKATGTYTQNFISSLGCDSTHSVDLTFTDTVLMVDQMSICEGDSVFIFGSWEKTEGTYVSTYLGFNACDSTAIIQLSKLPSTGFEEQFEICPGDSVLVFGEWETAGGVFTEAFPIPGACDSVHQVTVLAAEEIELEVTPIWTIQTGDSVQLTVELISTTSELTFNWFPSESLTCTNCPSPISRPLASSTYLVTVTDEQGCTATAELLVNVESGRSVYLPTAFSPNGDGINDVLFPQGIEGSATILRFSIFDRWGEQVFENRNFSLNDRNQGWDGTFIRKEMMSGVYVSLLELEWADGSREILSGDVILIKD